MITIKEITDGIKNIEKKVLNPDTESLEIWYDIRFPVFRMMIDNLIKDPFIQKKIEEKKDNTKYLKKVYIKIYKIITDPVIYVFKNSSYLFFGDSNRRIQKDGKHWDIYTDPITIDFLKKNTITIEKAIKTGYKKPVPTKNHCYLENMLILKKFVKFQKYEFNDKVINDLNLIQKKIFLMFNLDIPILQIAYRRRKSFEKKQKLFELYFRLLKPKMIFLVCSYGLEYVIRAAKKTKIKTIELQHGVINHYHLGYDFNDELPKRSFPDYFFSFGDYWNNAANFPIKKENIISIGFPYLEKRLKQLYKNKKKKQVIFLSQRDIGKELSEQAIKYALRNPEINVIYKLHAAEKENWKANYELLNEKNQSLSNLQVISEHEPDLYTLLSESLVQVAVNSTVLYEGLVFGCKTFMFNMFGIEYMKEYEEMGYGKIINDYREIILPDLSTDNILEIDNLFKKNSKKILKNAIKMINSKNTI